MNRTIRWRWVLVTTAATLAMVFDGTLWSIMLGVLVAGPLATFLVLRDYAYDPSPEGGFRGSLLGKPLE